MRDEFDCASSSPAVVALSGGTGSALVAYLVASVFEENTVLCIGKSAALQPEKLQRARFVADLLGELFLSQMLSRHEDCMAGFFLLF